MMSEDGGDDYQIVRMMMDGSMGEGAATPHLAHTTLVHHALHVHSSQSYASSETTALASVAQMKTERQPMQVLELVPFGRISDRACRSCTSDGKVQPPRQHCTPAESPPSAVPKAECTTRCNSAERGQMRRRRIPGHKRLLCPAQPPSSAQPLVLLDDNDNDNDNDYDNDDSRRPTTSSSALRIASTTLTS
ncbi:predicted protein [Plenodomus lingam JN3]|uniref:Predicted protein n=1 Tax=Leptosphaeria maculans (strain JN3 / isolate v23.1.3 / race Av1-4-5-6-7-8) TaxID=985895 RepID=E4ZIU7_LEPMJ|nr:predicted protein [Plenodomus lingam JN3]CBX91217.1 predicted protein [Plenodomus lingam JN3]